MIWIKAYTMTTLREPLDGVSCTSSDGPGSKEQELQNV